MLGCYKQHMKLMKPFDIFIPKHHLMIHLTMRALYHGNPKFSAVWRDESYNKQLKMVLRKVHQLTFESRGLIKMSEFMATIHARLQSRKRKLY